MRISAISYLNTAPLMWDFEHGLAPAGFDISYTIPSECARQLQNGTADIGIIPSAAYASIPELSILRGVAIASKQPVRSILLVSSKPLQELRAVALDSSSLTSAALTQVLFARFWGGSPKFISAPPDLHAMLAKCEAALLIGDPALKVDRSLYHTWDLAEEWIRFTGKPFVFAFWAVRNQAAQISNLELSPIFQKSRDHGLEKNNLRQTAVTWAAKLKITEQRILDYLTSNIYYYLDDECLDGLRLFYQYAHECGVLPRVPDLNFVSTTPALI